MKKATINEQQYKSSFGLEIDMIKVDHETTVPGRKSIDGYILSKSNHEYFKSHFEDQNEIFVCGSVVISSIEVSFLSKFIITEMVLGVNEEDETAYKMTSNGNVFFDFSGIDIENINHICELLYSK